MPPWLSPSRPLAIELQRPSNRLNRPLCGDSLRRLSAFSCLRFSASGRISQRAAQVAAWHLNNDMSFQELAAKELRRANGARQPYFSPQEIRAGMQITMMANKLAEQRKQTPSTADSASLK